MTSETISLRTTISPRAEKWIRISAVMAMFIVALSSAILSFDGLKKVALDAQVPSHLAFLFPIAVDTTILMGSLAVLLYELFGVRAIFGWVTVLFGTLLSIVGNVISVVDAGLIAQVLHGIIPVLLCISLESLLRILRFNIKRTRLAHESLPPLQRQDEVAVEENTEASQRKVEAEKVLLVASQPVSRSEQVSRIPSTSETNTLAPKSEASYRETPVFTESVNEDSKCEPIRVPAIPVSVELTSDSKQSIAPAQESVIVIEASVEPVPVVEPPETARVVEVRSASSEVKPVTSPTPIIEESPRPRATKTGGTKAVERYRIVLEAFPEDTPKGRKVAEILRAYPNASGTDIKAALGDPPDLRIDATVRRAKEWLKKNQA